MAVDTSTRYHPISGSTTRLASIHDTPTVSVTRTKATFNPHSSRVRRKPPAASFKSAYRKRLDPGSTPLFQVSSPRRFRSSVATFDRLSDGHSLVALEVNAIGCRP